MGIYSAKLASIAELADGAEVGIPNDTTNGGRALALLEKAGLLKLKDGAGISATINDIVENPKNLKIRELDAAMLPRALQDLGIAVINGNYALQADLSPTEDSLFLEDGDSPYANVVATRKDNADDPAIKKLVKVLTSDEVRKFIEDTYQGAVIPTF